MLFIIYKSSVIYADTHFDTLPYDADWIDEKMWTLRSAEKIGIKLDEKDFDNIKSIIKNALNNKNLSNEIEVVKNECWQNIGKSTELIVDYLSKGEKQIS